MKLLKTIALINLLSSYAIKAEVIYCNVASQAEIKVDTETLKMDVDAFHFKMKGYSVYQSFPGQDSYTLTNDSGKVQMIIEGGNKKSICRNASCEPCF